MTTVVEESVTAATDRWLAAAAGMPPLTGAAGTAERLLLLVHYGIDWQDGWVSRYRTSYWDKLLPDRIVTATYRCGNLPRWWTEIAAELDCTARTGRQRVELQHHLSAPDPMAVLELLRLETTALVLRTRITTEQVRASKADPA